MRRYPTSYLIAVMLAGATWACDEQAPTSPTPLAAVPPAGWPHRPRRHRARPRI